MSLRYATDFSGENTLTLDKIQHGKYVVRGCEWGDHAVVKYCQTIEEANSVFDTRLAYLQEMDEMGIVEREL